MTHLIFIWNYILRIIYDIEISKFNNKKENNLSRYNTSYNITEEAKVDYIPDSGRLAYCIPLESTRYQIRFICN